MPTAFVLMPLAEEFDGVYTYFIKSVLEDAGFEVVRADEIKGQNNILRDVIEGIARSDLIVADMTRANANVFYELGIAHTLRKPVVHITQSRKDSPFDIESYRSLEYDTHFSEIGKAKENLAKLAKDFLQGTAQFGNPVSDFYPSVEVEEGSEQEFRDYLNGLRETCNEFTEKVSDLVRELNEHGRQVSREVMRLSLDQRRAVETMCSVLAQRINDLGSRVQMYNDDYAKSITSPEGGLEFLISRYLGDRKENHSSDELPRNSLLALETSLLINSSRLIHLAWRLGKIPSDVYLRGFAGQRIPIERAGVHAGAEIRSLVKKFDKTNASIARALKKHAEQAVLRG